MATGRARRGRGAQMSEEERARRLAEMAADAQLREEMRYRRVQADLALEKREECEHLQTHVQDDAPSFLVKLNSSVYGSEEASIEDRIRRNVHYREKGPIEEKGIASRH